MVRHLTRQTLKDKAYEEIKSAIIKNEMRPGQLLSIDGLAAMLDTSPTPVREALAVLSSEGLVSIEPHRRLRVFPLTEEAIKEAYEVRLVLEVWAARETSRKVESSPALRRSLQALRTAVTRMLDQSPGELPKEASVGVDLKLHDILTGSVDNKLMRELLDLMGSRSMRIRTYVESDREPRNESVITKEHLEIIQQLLAGNSRMAQKAVVSHLRRAEERTLKTLRMRLQSDAEGGASTARLRSPAPSGDAVGKRAREPMPPPQKAATRQSTPPLGVPGLKSRSGTTGRGRKPSR